MHLRTYLRLFRLTAALALLALALLPVQFAAVGPVWLLPSFAYGVWLVYSLTESQTLSCPRCGHGFGAAVLLRSRCPGCQQPVPPSAKVPLRRGIPMAMVSALLLTALVAGGIYTRPHPLPDLLEADAPLTVQYDPPWHWDDDVGVMVPGTSVEWTLEPDSPEAAAIQDALDGALIRRCWDTLTDSGSMGGPLGNQVTISNGDTVLIIPDGGRLYLDGAVYQVGWLGEDACRALSAALRDVLELP